MELLRTSGSLNQRNQLNQQNKELAQMSAEGTKNIPIAEELQDSTKAVRQGEELDIARLEPYLRTHFPDARRRAGGKAISQRPFQPHLFRFARRKRNGAAASAVRQQGEVRA